MFRLFHIYSVRSRKLLLLKGTYDLRTDQLQGQWEQVAAPFLKISPRTFDFTGYENSELSASQEYLISGVSLEEDVVIQAPEGYLIRANYNPPYAGYGSWERTLSLHPDEEGTILECTIHIQLTETVLGDYNGKISHSSANLITQYVTLRGEVVQKPEPIYTSIKFGYLYNYACMQRTGASSLISSQMETQGWRLPSSIDYIEFIQYLSTETLNAIYKLTQEGEDYWSAPLPGVTNIVNFNSRGSGVFTSPSSVFWGVKLVAVYLTTDTNPESPQNTIGMICAQNENGAYIATYVGMNSAGSIRLMRAATTQEQSFPDGTICDPYIGCDGKVYPTTKIADKVWTAQNLAETLFQNNTSIPYVDDMYYWQYEMPIVYSDWWLPTSLDCVLIHQSLYLSGIGDFSGSVSYWTSVEASASMATLFHFGTGTEGTTAKSLSLLVRPVRKFNGSIGQYLEGNRGPAGGWIYYVQPLGGDACTYHEVAPSDLPAEAWSNITSASCGAIYTPAGAGLLNSNIIVAQEGHTSSAAQTTLDYSITVSPPARCAYDNDPANV